MSLSRRRFSQCLFAGLAVGTLPTVHAGNLVEGRDWIPVSPPQPGDGEDRVEVLEFFSYGCPHCRDLHPLITAWTERLPQDVALRRIPVSFGRAAWANLARLYFALELSGDLERLDQTVFDAIHEKRTNLYTKSRIFDWAVRQGLDAGAFGKVFDSFAVQTCLGRSESLARGYQVNQVPLITVDGRYKVVGKAVTGLPHLLTIADELIELARQRR